MLITYHGHSCFKLKSKRGSVVTDPFDPYIGFSLPKLSAELVTVSHNHKDHNAAQLVQSANPDRDRPFIIDSAGEYEVGGISVFGERLYHDSHQGVERGESIAFTMLLDDLRVCHLGDLGHELTEQDVEKIGLVDILLIPVGGTFTINPEQALQTIREIEPSIVIPMHFKTEQHNAELFGELKTLADFTKEYGAEPPAVAKFSVEKETLPEELTLVILSQT